MLYDQHTERINIGYEGINSINEIVIQTKTLSKTFNEFFDDFDEEYYITLRQEPYDKYQTTLHYINVNMSELFAPIFVLYFSDKYKLISPH